MVDFERVSKYIAAKTMEYQLVNKGKRDLKLLKLYESQVENLYWDVMVRVFNAVASQFNFQGRCNKSNSNNMNASDEINAMLNYGYAVLESWVRKYICAVGLDNSIGFLHHL